MGLMVLSAAIAHAQSNVVATPDLTPAPAIPAEAPVYPKRPAEMAPKLPKVTCQGDQITISADNSTLEAVLADVKGCTGAKIEIPAGASRIRAFEELGPGPVRKVLDQLLSGTPYNYVIESSEANPLRVEKVSLSMRASDSDKPGSDEADVPLSNGRQLWKRMQKFDKPDPSSINEDGAVDGEPVLANENIAATPAPADPNGAPPPAASDAPAPDASASVTPPLTPVAPPVVEPGSTADPSKAIQDRISSMQQLFNQRQQMIQKQNQPPAGSPNN
jgi:hypothetical protein